jgi:hypothetical protein
MLTRRLRGQYLGTSISPRIRGHHPYICISRAKCLSLSPNQQPTWKYPFFRRRHPRGRLLPRRFTSRNQSFLSKPARAQLSSIPPTLQFKSLSCRAAGSASDHLHGRTQHVGRSESVRTARTRKRNVPSPPSSTATTAHVPRSTILQPNGTIRPSTDESFRFARIWV